MTVVTFSNARPGKRYDGNPWIAARIEQSTLLTGPWVEVETFTFEEIDSDPRKPRLRSITTELGTLDAGYYRLVFIDGDGDETATEPRLWPPPPNIRPDVDDVALLLRTRTTGGLSTGLGADTGPGDLTTFNEDTRPSFSEVERIIDIAYGAVLGELTPVDADEIPASQLDQVRHAIALYAAILIETSFFREEADEAALGIWRDLYSEAISRVSGAITPSGRTRRMVSVMAESPYGGGLSDDLVPPELPL